MGLPTAEGAADLAAPFSWGAAKLTTADASRGARLRQFLEPAEDYQAGPRAQEPLPG